MEQNLIICTASLIAKSQVLTYLFTNFRPVIYGGFLRDLAFLLGQPRPMPYSWADIADHRKRTKTFNDIDVHNEMMIQPEQLMRLQSRNVKVSKVSKLGHSRPGAYIIRETMDGAEFVIELHCCNEMSSVDVTVNCLCLMAGPPNGQLMLFSKTAYSQLAPLPVWLIIEHCKLKALVPFDEFYNSHVRLESKDSHFSASIKKLLDKGYRINLDVAAKDDAFFVAGCFGFTIASARFVLHTTRDELLASAMH